MLSVDKLDILDKSTGGGATGGFSLFLFFDPKKLNRTGGGSEGTLDSDHLPFGSSKSTKYSGNVTGSKDVIEGFVV